MTEVKLSGGKGTDLPKRERLNSMNIQKEIFKNTYQELEKRHYKQ
jgi:hypothetical protein